MPIRGFLSHIDLNVSHPATSIDFYETVLGALGFDRTELDEPERASWRIILPTGAHFEIEVRPPRGALTSLQHRRADPGLDHLAFHAESRTDVDEIFELLRLAGHFVDEPPREYDYVAGYYAVGFDDPDGIRLEVVYDPGSNP